MLTKQHQNHRISLLAEKKGYKTYVNYFVATLTVAVFVIGGGTAVYRHFFTSDKQSQNEISSEIPGWWLSDHFGSSVCSQDICKADADPDKDKLTNAQEFFYHTDPLSAYTVKDEATDGELVAMGFDPSREGRITFDEVTSDENILGESLVYEDDIKKLIAETQDIDKIDLKLVENTELKINYTQSGEVLKKYLDDLDRTVAKYFSASEVRYAQAVLQSGDSHDLSNLGEKSKRLSTELKQITVPEIFVNFHKYTIAFYQLLPEVIVMDGLEDSDVASNEWFDKAQAFLAVQQKMNFEKEILSKRLSE